METVNLPELLAQDLSRSEDVFRRRDMTGGSPVPLLATDTGSHHYSLAEPRKPGVGAIHTKLGGVRHVHNLTRTGEWRSSDDHLASLQNHSSKPYDNLSEAGSEGSTQLDSPSSPFSPRHRGESIITEATSVSNKFCDMPSTKPTSKRERIRSGIFLDFGEIEDSMEGKEEKINVRVIEEKEESVGEKLNRQKEIKEEMYSKGNEENQVFQKAHEMKEEGSHVRSRGNSEVGVPHSTSSMRSKSVALDPPPNIRRVSKLQPTLLIPARKASYRWSMVESEASISPQSAVSPRTKLRFETKSLDKRMSTNEVPSQSPDIIAPAMSSVEKTTRNSSKSGGDVGGKQQEMKLELPSADDFSRLSPFSPSTNVQTWLDSSIVHSPNPQDECGAGSVSAKEGHLFGVAAGLPLPQSVLNTLKISTLYFPDTMLLSSSLSIETIRTYARKLRQPPQIFTGGPGGLSEGGINRSPSPWSPPPSPPEHHGSKKWYWPIHRKGSVRGHHTDSRAQGTWTISGHNTSGGGPKHFDSPTQSSGAHQINAPAGRVADVHIAAINGGKDSALTESSSPGLVSSSCPPLQPPNWIPLKNIFRGASDYLCDALYAHVVAYNYISCLCGRGVKLSEAEGSSSSGPGQGATVTAFETGRIPRKAATLLGLSDLMSELALSDNERDKEQHVSTTVTLRNKWLDEDGDGHSSCDKDIDHQGEEKGNNKHCSAKNCNMQEQERLDTNAKHNSTIKVRRGTVPNLVCTPTPIPSATTLLPDGGGSGGTGERDTLREIRGALAACIACLVSALRQGENGRVGSGCLVRGASVPYLDPLFLRALCEVVRCAEGGGPCRGRGMVALP